jgi:hypothetical protein
MMIQLVERRVAAAAPYALDEAAVARLADQGERSSGA